MMIETNFMRAWAGIVESVAIIAIAILAIGLMVNAVKPSDAARHLGAILGIVILLLMLPAIIASAWSVMSFWQHLGLAMLGITIGLSLWALRGTRNKR
jgi:hypothetical protein